MEGIMVSAATGVMNSLLTKLTTLLGEEYKLQKEVKRDVAFLKDELSSMNTILEKLADTEVLDPEQKEWRNQVREMAYDIEDCIDDYMHRPHQDSDKSNGIKGFLSEMIEKVKKLGACHEIAEQLRELKTRIVEASQRRDRYKLDAVLYVEASSLIGIDVPRDELIKLVDDGEKSLKVVSIVGHGGLGKTTVANQVYQKVGGQFDCRAFVSVSQKPDTRKILRSILSQIRKQEYEGTESGDEECLINALRDFLKDKRYFIVIDDILSTEAWEIIKCALLENTCGSRILVTTRIVTVAKSCCSPRHDLVYELRPLSESDSKSLFLRRVFGSEDKRPLQLEKVSNEIIRKCGGLPLALITLSNLLTTKSSREEWLMVLNSIGLGLEKNSVVEDMKKIISLSYNDLPLHLRTCLLYLSMFPEDYEIQRDRLVSRWIAEGFVKVDGGRNLMEEGECYFNELINRSMIQPVDIQYDGRADACLVHDMVLDLIISKAVEENLITSVGDQTHSFQSKIRRLSLGYRGKENVIVTSSMAIAHVRSLSIFGCSVQMPSISDLHALRVLDIETTGMLENCNLRNIGKLFQLRYLRIEAESITNLPEQIGELQYLETLDLWRTGISELPASIVKLRRLERLLGRVKLPDGVGNMQALEELSDVFVNDESSINSLQELGNLTKLRTLHLVWCIGGSHRDMYADILASSLGKLCSSNLRCLHVRGSTEGFRLDSWSSPARHLRELVLWVNLKGIPEWMASLTNLTFLSIRVNQVTQETFQILGALPTLLKLALLSQADGPTKERLIVCNGGFQRLKYFYSMASIMGPMFEAGAMPKLEELTFVTVVRVVQSACGLGIHHLSALRELFVEIDSRGARVEEVEAWKASIKNEASLLPNRPTPVFRRYRKEQCEGTLHDIEGVPGRLKSVKLELLEKATGGFSEKNKIGSGGYGKVYKGVLNGKEIAVKKLHWHPALDDVILKNEIENLMRVQHQNIVEFVGYCNETRHIYVEHNGRTVRAEQVYRVLCFEYLQNGSLDKHLYEEHRGLDWCTRYKIIKGICEGLNYLHGLEESILHLDLKPANILLDENMVPKITDFGLSRLFGGTHTHITKNPVDVETYMPPEYVNEGRITKKHDVFSLGFIIIQIITGHEGCSKYWEMSPQKFIELVHQNWKVRVEATSMHTSAGEDCKQVKRCIEIALNCVELERQKRPTIGDIIHELRETETITHQVPRTARDLRFKLLEKITGGFSKEHEIGSGGYGKVYKGVLNGKVIAVKKLHGHLAFYDVIFKNELENLMRVRHQNIVELVGYCDELRHRCVEHNGRTIYAELVDRALCFEYLQKGSLDKHLYEEHRGLDWCTRYKIIKGICEGLNYLHGLEKSIVHLDLKPANILLDENMVPKIADFGLSRLFGETHTHITKNHDVGTRMYMPPEYLNEGRITKKHDVFSLGFIIIQIMTGREGCSKYWEMSPQKFIELVHQNWKVRVEATSMHTSAGEDCKQVERCIEIALNCVKAEREERPTIGDIIHKLRETETMTHEVPMPFSQESGNASSSHFKTAMVQRGGQVKDSSNQQREVLQQQSGMQ